MNNKLGQWVAVGVLVAVILTTTFVPSRSSTYPNAALEMPKDALHVQVEGDNLWMIRQLNRPDGTFDLVLERHPLTAPTTITQTIVFHRSAE